MRTRAPQSRSGAHVPAGPVRPSPIERPWRTMFAATVSAFCTPCANPRAPCSGAQRAPQNADLLVTKTRTRAPRNRSGGTSRPGLYAPRLTNGHGEQCSPLRSQHFARPAPKPVPPVAAHSVRHKMRTRAPRNRGGAHVPAGPVRPSPDERPWRTMFAATVSAFCTPCAETRATCSGAHCAPQNADPFAAKPRRGTRSGRACTPLAHRTAMANNVRRYGLGILYALRRNPCHL